MSRAVEHYGWHKSVAGDADFTLACNAIVDAVNSGRGLFITGVAGVGKSQLLASVYQALHHGREKSWLYCKDAQHITWMRNSMSIYFDRDVFIDDMGAEDVVKEYGSVVDVVGDFIQMYHSRGNGNVFFTTNLNSDGINQKYGGRVLSRLLEMCVVLKLSGKDKRERKVYA